MPSRQPIKSSKWMDPLHLIIYALVIFAAGMIGFLVNSYLHEQADSQMAIAAPDWKTYTNSQFGFQLTLTDAWRDYKVFVSESSQAAGSPTYFAFALPTADKTKCITEGTGQVCGYVAPLTIYRFNKDKVGNVGSMDGKFADHGNDVFYYSLYTHFHQYPADLDNKDLQIPQIISSFKFTK